MKAKDLSRASGTVQQPPRTLRDLCGHQQSMQVVFVNRVEADATIEEASSSKRLESAEDYEAAMARL